MSEPSHEEVYQFVRENPKPFVKTSEVKEEFSDTSGRTVYNRLQDLVERGRLEKTLIGANSLVWWIDG